MGKATFRSKTPQPMKTLTEIPGCETTPGLVAGGAGGRFLSEIRGTTGIEYSVVAAGIALAVTLVIRVLGANVLSNLYSQLAGLFG